MLKVLLLIFAVLVVVSGKKNIRQKRQLDATVQPIILQLYDQFDNDMKGTSANKAKAFLALAQIEAAASNLSKYIAVIQSKKPSKDQIVNYVAMLPTLARMNPAYANDIAPVLGVLKNSGYITQDQSTALRNFCLKQNGK